MEFGINQKTTSRPRVLGWIKSAAFLDGDWGTSIAYVLGISFALAGYSSFWHLCFMLGLTTLVAVNYITICRIYQNGGGVYSSVYHRSKTFAVIGALLLVADYVITIALSVLEGCHYLGIANASTWAITVIFVIGAINWLGPKNTGSLSVIISLATMIMLSFIIVASAPVSFANNKVAPLSSGFFHNWKIFAGIILSISGIEAISNMTGLIKDPERDSRKAILAVLAKIIVVTVFLGLAMCSIPQLQGHPEDMVRFLGEHYVGAWFGWIVAISLGFLLFSAGNTAMNDLVSIQFLMSNDNELPSPLNYLNRYGMPYIPLIIATSIPVIILILIKDVLSLAQLYAIGVVGAILINVGSTATDATLNLKSHVRIMMICSAIILLFIELSIAIEKPKATIFASLILTIGLTARYVANRKRTQQLFIPGISQVIEKKGKPVSQKRSQKLYLVALRGKDEKLLHYAIEEARSKKLFLTILRIKEIAVGVLPEKILIRPGKIEKCIQEICDKANIDYRLLIIPSYEVGYTIAEQAALLGVERVILGATRRSFLESAFKGNVIRAVNKLLPDEIQLIIFRG